MDGVIIEKQGEFNNFPYVISFCNLGHRCGYVGLPKGHKYYGLRESEIHLNCHGGITYANNELLNIDADNTWWIGFDCGHYPDGIDIKALTEIFGASSVAKLQSIMSKEQFEYKCERIFMTLDDCEAECINIIKQL